jgi:tetratricopeptide (TPR) repeat protein
MTKKITQNLQMLLNEALSFCQKNRLNDAKIIYQKILNKYPTNLQALINLGSIELQIGDLNEGIHLLKKALNIEPNQPNVLSNLGNGLSDLHLYDEAMQCYKKSIEIDSTNPGANYNLARLLRKKNELNDAIQKYSVAIHHNFFLIDAYYGRGLCFYDLGMTDSAIEDFSSCIEIDKFFLDAYWKKIEILHANQRYEDLINVYNNLLDNDPKCIKGYIDRGATYLKIREYEKALLDFSKALSIDPECNQAYNNIGVTFDAMGDCESAILNYNQAIKNDASYYEAFSNRGAAYNSMGKFELAIKDCDAAIKIKPDYIDALINKGAALKNLKLYIKAREYYDEAIKISRGSSELAYSNRAALLVEIKEYDSAEEDLKKAIEINRNSNQANLNLSLFYLSHKKFLLGWPLYKKRIYKDEEALNFLEQNSKPEVSSFSSENKLLIFSEQGLGDQILYLSLLAEIEAVNPNITVLIDPRLIRIFERSFPKIKFLSKYEHISKIQYDTFIFSGDLGGYFRNSESLFSRNKNSYLTSDSIRTRELDFSLRKDSKKVCGISWTSKNLKFGQDKSLRLVDLLPILELANFEFVNLQYGDTDNEIKAIYDDKLVKINSINEIDNQSDIDGLTSLIDACDVVVTISNVTAHIAGALGKKTFLLLPYSKGRIWYWFDGDEKSIWYPSIKQYFQEEKNGNWHNAIFEISAALKRI